ncbi:MAG: hypothetical protein PVF43_03605 [Candidatus Eiseniibacteriota bacterium]
MPERPLPLRARRWWQPDAWRRVSTAILDSLVPSACALCQQTVDGGTLCNACELEVAALPAPPPVSIDALTVRAACWYLGTGQALVQALKYRGRRDLASRVARMMRPQVHRLLARGERPLLVPVPLHRRRALARGYNQAELLARGLLSDSGGRRVSLLVRRRATRSQTRLGAVARRANLAGAFGVRARVGQATQAPVVLIDDVVTTGATLREAARTLEQAGWRVAGAVVAARADRLPADPTP